MDIETQILLSEYILNGFKTFKVNTIEAIGLLEVIKMSLYSYTPEGDKNDNE